MKTIITFIIVFGVLVLVHEFGHFFFAKRSGILVREFAIGMGPKIYGHQDKAGTTYTLRMLPVGGYVRMAGLEEEDSELTPGMPLSVMLNEQNEVVKINMSKKVQLANSIPLELIRQDLLDDLTLTGYVNGDESEETTYAVDHDATIIEEDGTEVRIAPRDVRFQSAKIWQRMLTNFAGPMNNFILAIVVFAVVAFMQGGVSNGSQTALAGFSEDSPALAAGFKEGDKVLAVNGEKIDSSAELSTVIAENPDQEITVAIERDGQELELAVTPATAESEDGTTVGRLGITIASEPIIAKAGFFEKIAWGFTEAWSNSLNIFQALGSLITNFSIDKLGGPVMMFELSSQAASSGVISVLKLMAILSMNLGIMNLLPIPALDGGKLVLNVIEAVRGKPMNRDKEGIITLIGFGCLMLLMIAVTWNDIQRFLF